MALGRRGGHWSGSLSHALLETWIDLMFYFPNTFRHPSAMAKERARESKKDWLNWFCKSLCINI